MSKNLIKAAVVAAALCASATSFAAFKNYEVNGEKVTVEEQQLIYDTLIAQGRPAGAATETLARNIVTERKALAAAAEDAKLDRDSKTKLMMSTAQENVLRNALLDKWRSEIKVTDKEIRDRYDSEKRVWGDTEYHIARIFVKTKDEARAILKQLDKNPKDFEKLAKEKSLDKASGVNGGDLGWIVPAQTDPRFSSSYLYLKPGTCAQEPVEAGGGFNVVRLIDKRKAQNFPSFDKRKDAIKALLTEQKLSAKVADLMKKAEIE